MTDEIPDTMTTGATGAEFSWLVGKRIVAVYPVADSDRGEEIIVCDDGTVYGVSCDPIRDDPNNGYAPFPVEEWGQHGWEVYVYDCTDVPAGEAAREKAKVARKPTGEPSNDD